VIFNTVILNHVHEGRFIGWWQGNQGQTITDYTPKSMIPIRGRPVIDHIVRFVSKFTCVSEILIVCENDLFGSQIMNYFEGKDWLFQKKITFIEDRKNGTGGALLLCHRFLETESHFLVWYADNLCALDIRDLEQKFLTIQNEEW
jgi:mannose-1-phosphate guanylyltransferase